MFLSRKKQPVAAIPPLVSALPEPVALPDDVTRKKILVIDDDPVVLKTLTLKLNSNGYNVVTATDGSRAIGLMRDEAPDLMLVDVCLAPDVAVGGCVTWDGFQITQWLRQMNDHVPTIVISSTNNPEYKKRATAVGAQTFLPKPLDNDLLLTWIASSLSNQQPYTPVPSLKLDSSRGTLNRVAGSKF